MKGILISLIEGIRLLAIKLLPVKKSRFVFTSLDGHYSDSPRCISEELHRIDSGVEIVWLVEKNRICDLPEYVKAVDIKSKKCIWYLGTAHVLIDNVYGNKDVVLRNKNKKSVLTYKIKCFLKKKRGQLLFTTWHGTPLKKMGRDQINNVELDFFCFNSFMICDNDYTLKIMQRLTFDTMKMVLLGMPRNDRLLCCNNEEYSAVKSRLAIPHDKKCILFAPSFRNNGNDITAVNIERSGLNQLADINIEKLFECLSEKFGGEWVLICRFHYHAEKMIDWQSLKSKYGDRIINGNQNDDMSDYLVCADILLTDVSSCMFDFSLSKKPCFLFFPDIDYYINSERGLYYPIEKLPFPLSESFDGVLENIRCFNEKEYKEKLNSMFDEFGFVNCPDSSKRTAEFILSVSGEKV